MQTIQIVLLILAITWALFEALQKCALAYLLVKKDIQPSKSEIAECLRCVLKHHLKFK